MNKDSPQYKAADAKRAILALVPADKHDYVAALIEDHLTYRLEAAQNMQRRLLVRK